MEGKRKFKTSFWGFKKRDVIQYMQEILKEFKQVISQKDNKILSLEEKIKLLQLNSEDKTRIADVLIKAHSMLEDSKSNIEEERKQHEKDMRVCRQKLSNMQQDIEDLYECMKRAQDILNVYQTTSNEEQVDEEKKEIRSSSELNLIDTEYGIFSGISSKKNKVG